MIPFAQTHHNSTPQWHHIRLDAPQLAKREHERIKMLFSWFYRAARQPRDMSLWFAPDDGGGADVYILPHSTQLADDLIRYYRARPCGPPHSAVVLIAGNTGGAHAREFYTCTPSSVTTAASPCFLPVTYPCRAVGTLGRINISASWLYASNQLAPFVRRFALAWALLSASRTEVDSTPTTRSQDMQNP